jgi:hypothetical protein
MCPHRPQCAPADHPDRAAARTISCHPDQGWSLLCNGVIVFDDTGELLPDGRAVPPHNPIRNHRPSKRPHLASPLPERGLVWVS